MRFQGTQDGGLGRGPDVSPPPRPFPRARPRNRAALSLTHYRLKNGLNVILSEDFSLPIVSVAVAYDVGSLQEPPGQDRHGGRHGEPHVRGLGQRPSPPAFQLYQPGRRDVQRPAHGGPDRLLPDRPLEPAVPGPVARIRPDAIPRASEAAPSRMPGRPFSRTFATGGRAIRTTTAPGRSTGCSIPISPTAIPSTDWRRTSAGLTLDDLRAFYALRYGPNNAVLCITGHFDKLKTRELISQYFETLPRGRDVAPAAEPPALARKQVVETFVGSLSSGAGLPSRIPPRGPPIRRFLRPDHPGLHPPPGPDLADHPTPAESRRQDRLSPLGRHREAPRPGRLQDLRHGQQRSHGRALPGGRLSPSSTG